VSNCTLLSKLPTQIIPLVGFVLLDHINRAITEVMPLQGTVLPGDIPQLGIMFLIHVMKIDMEPIIISVFATLIKTCLPSRQY
jgi:hypothetical protein